MRLKGFILFIIIFTICYIVFFILYDRFNDKRNSADKILLKELDINKFYNFSKFYSINTTIDINTILRIYNLMIDTDNIKLSYIANQVNVSIDEVIIVVLYLEYLNYLSEKTICRDKDMITDFTPNDKALFDKYIVHFRNKSDLDTIKANCGPNAFEELFYINNYYIAEGVRIVDNKIYYAGDYNV